MRAVTDDSGRAVLEAGERFGRDDLERKLGLGATRSCRACVPMGAARSTTRAPAGGAIATVESGTDPYLMLVAWSASTGFVPPRA